MQNSTPEGWYVLRSKPQKEMSLARLTRAKGVECYFPSMKVNPVNPRARKIKAYFPGYLFVKADLDEWGNSFFKWMPHSLGLVRFGGEPAVVPDNLILGIQRTIQHLEEVEGEEERGLQAGDEVIIEDGPFTGYRAIFDTRISGEERVRVLLKMLNERREIPLELQREQIREVD